jgi:hypothetical protein
VAATQRKLAANYCKVGRVIRVRSHKRNGTVIALEAVSGVNWIVGARLHYGTPVNIVSPKAGTVAKR